MRVALRVVGFTAVAACNGGAPNDTEVDADLTRGPGALDPSLGGDGATVLEAGFSDQGRAVVVLADDRLLIAGKSNDDFLLIRTDAAGTLDPGFDDDGLVFQDIGTGTMDEGKSLAIQPDGAIVLAGITTQGGNGRFGIARFLDTGAPDPLFGVGGTTSYNFGPGNDEGKAVGLQADGALVMAGQAEVSSDNQDFAVVRFADDGDPDGGFGSGGARTTDVLTAPNEGNAIVIQPDGKLVVAGYAWNGTDDDFALVRYLPNGDLDPDLDGAGPGDGVVQTPVGASRDLAFGAALQPDGKVVLVGITRDGTELDCALVRYLPDGALDTTFDGDGIATTSIGADDECTAVTVQPDGKLVVVGTIADPTGAPGTDLVVLRYEEDGGLDTSFGSGGWVHASFGPDDRGFAVALHADGRIVAVGEAHNGTDFDVAVLRMFP